MTMDKDAIRRIGNVDGIAVITYRREDNGMPIVEISWQVGGSLALEIEKAQALTALLRKATYYWAS